MNLLALTEAGTGLLLESGILSRFFNLVTEPLKYYRQISARRAGSIEFTQLLMSLAGSRPEVT